MEKYNLDIERMPMTCPKCGRMSDSIKCFSLPNYIYFIGIAGGYQMEKKICCSKCMRKQILIKYFTYNIILGNLLWIIICFLPGLCKLYSSFRRGHSFTVKKFLRERYAETQVRQHYREAIQDEGEGSESQPYDLSRLQAQLQEG